MSRSFIKTEINCATGIHGGQSIEHLRVELFSRIRLPGSLFVYLFKKNYKSVCETEVVNFEGMGARLKRRGFYWVASGFYSCH